MACSSLIILTFMVGFRAAQSDPCRPVCTGSSCVMVHESRVDFPTAEERCRSNDGELMTIHSPDDERLLNMLSGGLRGGFWIGLRLPEHVCSNMSDPLRGYEWIYKRKNLVPAAATWKDGVKVCSPRCVTISRDQVFSERVCSDVSDGFLCRTHYKDACKAQRVSELKVFKSKKGCSDAPCQQICNKVSDGYTCACAKGYAPDSKDPHRCKVHCDQEKCPAICDRNTPDSCQCAVGYIKNDKFCEDIDECAMDQCQHLCRNTFGSFVCSCEDGFVLKDEVNCVKAMEMPKPNDESLTSSSRSATGFIWLWVLLAAAVILVICVGRYFIVRRQKHREVNLQQVTSTAADNVAH